MRQFGIIGRSLSHSFSPAYFRERFRNLHIDACYDIFEFEDIRQVRTELDKRSNLSGINVTIPYKTDIITYLDYTDPAALNIGAVNCIKIDKGKWLGFNTDHEGFRQSLEKLIPNKHMQALILGTGGSAKAVAYALQYLGVPYKRVSRTGGINTIPYEALDQHIIKEHLLIINTSPLGMYPDINNCPALPYEYIGRHHFLFDLIYNPAKTLFLQKGEHAGAQIRNGMEMLKIQAETGWAIWNNPHINSSLIRP